MVHCPALQSCCQLPWTLCHMQACHAAAEKLKAAFDSCAIESTALLLQRSWMPLE